MSLVKDQNEQSKPKPKKAQGHSMKIVSWPDLWPSFRFGFGFGTGFGVAMAIAVPIVVTVLLCTLSVLLTLFGTAALGLLAP